MNRLSLFLSVTFAAGLFAGACDTTSDGGEGGAGGGAGTESGGAGGATMGGATGTTSGGAGGATGGSGGKTGGSGVGGSGGAGGTAKGGMGGTTNTGGVPGDSCNTLAVQGEWIDVKSIPSSPGFTGGTIVPGLYYLTSVAIIEGNSSELQRQTVRITPEPNSIMEWSVEFKNLNPPGIVANKFNATYTLNGKTLTRTRTCNPSGAGVDYVYTATGNTLTLGRASFVYTLTRQP